MKGTVVSIWLKTIEKIYGGTKLKEAQKNVSWGQELVITPLMDIEDEVIFGLIREVARLEGKEVGNIWREIGKQNIKSFSEWFPSYFRGRSLKNFLMMMDIVHLQLTSKIPGAKPPRLYAKEINNNTLEIRYVSKRKLYDYFLGLLEGSSDFFSEEMEIREVERGEETDGGFLKVELIFRESFKVKEKYLFNKLLSFGFIKSLSIKTGILTTILSLVILLALTNWIREWWYPLISALGAGGLTTFFMIFLTSPFKKIRNEIKEIQKLNFADTVTLVTGDEFEDIFNQIKKFKEVVKEDVLFLKGGTDDLFNFTRDFVDISNKMGKVSDGISSIVDEVAQAAQQQANETEESVYIIDNNIKKIKDLALAGSESKDNLGEAVASIQSSAREVEGVNKRIADVKSAFSDVNNMGLDLEERLSDIMKIVETVSDIANQTNLLSLNASIEAARSSDNSRGFAVVAEEIRELAEHSKVAGKSIKDNLIYFTEKVKELIEGISAQFASLEESNKTLINVTESNNQSSDNVEQASEQVVNIVDELNSETKQILEVINNLNSLAAIAEENSAASQEMSASVSDYSEKIKQMSFYINQMEELVESFQNNLDKYII